MTTEQEMIDHLGEDCEAPDAIHCDKCGKVIEGQQIAFADDDRAWCTKCYDYLIDYADNEYYKRKEEGY
jgi:hypothetical protein